jgi:hypothetical protein
MNFCGPMSSQVYYLQDNGTKPIVNGSYLYADLDAFYPLVEVRGHPELKGKPVVVGADPKEGKGRGVVSRPPTKPGNLALDQLYQYQGLETMSRIAFILDRTSTSMSQHRIA